MKEIEGQRRNVTYFGCKPRSTDYQGCTFNLLKIENIFGFLGVNSKQTESIKKSQCSLCGIKLFMKTIHALKLRTEVNFPCSNRKVNTKTMVSIQQ